MHVRPLREADAESLAPLCAELGYPSDTGRVERRLRAVLALPGQGLFGAEQDGQLVGCWVHVQLRVVLESDSFAEVCALVVDERRRGRCIGRSLMAAAERWAEETGQTQVQLRSNVTRTRTHAFYQQLGYAIRSTSHRFVKELGPSSG